MHLPHVSSKFPRWFLGGLALVALLVLSAVGWGQYRARPAVPVHASDPVTPGPKAALLPGVGKPKAGNPPVALVRSTTPGVATSPRQTTDHDPPPALEDLLLITKLRKWTTATLSHPRGGLVGIYAGGKVFFAGGKVTTTGAAYSGAVDMYDVATGVWSTNGLSIRRAYLAATTAHGKVYFGGGETPDGPTDRVDVYDLATGTWSVLTLTAPRSHLVAGVTGNTVFFYGGTGTDGKPSDVLDFYNPAFVSDFAAFPPGSLPRLTKGIAVSSPAYDADNPSTLWLFGGENEAGFTDPYLTLFRDPEVYEAPLVQSGFLTDVERRSRMTATNGHITAGGNFFKSVAVVAGGKKIFPDPEDVDALDMITADGIPNPYDGFYHNFRLSIARSDLASATADFTGRWLFAGGSINGQATDRIDFFDGQYVRPDTLPLARFGLAGVGVESRGMALFAGGFTGGGESSTARVDIYTMLNPYTGQPYKDGLEATPLPLPVFTLQPTPTSQTSCVGGTVRVRVTSPELPVVYQWYKGEPNPAGAVRLPGQNKPELRLTNLQPTDAGTYYCRIWNGVRGTWSDAFTLAVSSGPSVPGRPAVAGAPFCAGGPLSVGFGVSGCETGTYVAQLSNASGSFANPTVLGAVQPGTTPLTLPPTLPPGTGYRVRIVSTQPTQTSAASAPFQVGGPGLSGLTPGVTGTPVCRGQAVTVSFNPPGGSCPFPENNRFTAQLSNALGSFANPTDLGSVLPGVANPVTIPAGVTAGTGYRLRIVGTQPQLTSSPSGPFRVTACNARLSADPEYSEELVVAPNPASGSEIRCRVGGLHNPRFSLSTADGRGVDLDAVPDGTGEYVLTPRQPRVLGAGLYVLQAADDTRQLTRRVLVVE